MPMIDLTIESRALDAEARKALARELLTALLRWEGAPNNERSMSLAWTFVNVVETIEVGSSPSGLPHYRVGVRTPEGALNDEKRTALVKEATEIVLRAEGSEFTPENAFRVWVILDEVAEGSWGAEGRIWRFADIINFVGVPTDADAVTPPADALTS